MKRTLNVMKTCQCCGRTFAAKTTVTRYCSIQCRNKAYYRNLKEAGQKKPGAVSASRKPKPVIPEPAVVPAGREYMKVAEAAALLGVCKQTVYNMGMAGKLEILRLTSRLSLVRRSGIEAMFDHAQPYRARPKRPTERIEEFRSLEEIARSRNLSESRIHKVAKSRGIQKVLHKGRTYLPKREVDEIFKPKKTRPAVYITLEEALHRYPVSYQRLYYIIRKNDVPKLYDGRLVKVDTRRLDSVMKHTI